jgi:hypothetical protein
MPTNLSNLWSHLSQMRSEGLVGKFPIAE